MRNKPTLRGIPKEEPEFSDKRIKYAYYDNPEPRTLEEYVKLMKGYSKRYLQIIGEYADTKKPSYTTKGQWYQFTQRWIKTARELSPYTDEQIEDAYKRLKLDMKRSKDFTRWTLNTILKYME